ncbi:MAG: heavy metal translocating P-type ATPase [Clostridia bacterium]|nr:heavy metal translocating P-type ATPase [Clostridia bacterium]
MSKNCGCSECHGHEHHHAEIETCGCGHCGSEEKTENKVFPVVITVLGALLIAFSFLPFLSEVVSTVMLITAMAVCGLPVFFNAVKAVMKFKINESLLLVIAVIAAFFLGEYFEAAVVAVLFRVGELMEDYASDRSRKSIESIFGIVSDSANLVLPDGTIEKVDADDILIDDIIAILPHETVPVDGVVVSGAGSVNASALTGESMPVAVEKGSNVLSGMINGDSTVHIRATAVKNQSSAARIVEMVEEAAQKKGEAQRDVTTFAKYYTPAIIAAAIVIAVVPSLITGDWNSWIYRSLILLVASCPCAVVLSAPLAFFSSMGAAAKNGMIIKGSRYIESLAKADTVVFDKTGTLTTGELKVGNVYTCGGNSVKDVISFAARCEYYSTHPIAKAIVLKNGETDMSKTDGFTEIAGGGTSITAPEGRILCGGKRLMKNNAVDISALPDVPVYVALNGSAVGAIEIDGEIRPTARKTVERLRKAGVKHSLILTGDSAEHAKKVCDQCDIDEFRSGLLPEDKLNALEEIKSSAKGVIYVGDGINDAPVLAAADVGIAMGLGTQAACEASDVILTNSELSRLADTICHSKRTMSVLKANIAFAITVKIAVVALGIIGVAPMWSAILADVGTMIICVANSARLMNIKR